MPYLSDEFHDWWLERVLCGDFDVDKKGTTLVRGVRGALEDTLEVSKVIKSIRTCRGLGERFKQDTGVRVLLYILNLFDQTTIPIGRHDYGGTGPSSRSSMGL